MGYPPAMIQTPEFDLDVVRGEVPLLRTHIPMNACSQAPQSDRTRRAAEAYLTSWAADGMDWDRWMSEVETARAEFAALVGGEANDVAVATSVSQATASVASGLDYTGRRFEVVVSGAEFPTVSHVWLAQKRFGAEVVAAPARSGTVPMEAYDSAITERTLVVSAALGYYQTGAVQDVGAIAELAHGRGALLFVDGYQALGTRPFDAPSSGARRLDLGTPPVMEAYVARAGMAWLRELGLEAVASWTRTLSEHLADRARELGLTILEPSAPAARTPTTAFACADSHRAEERLRRRGIIASARGPALRLAPHFYNTLDDVDRAVEALAEELEEGSATA